jgi:hypothetical protein
MTLHLEGEKRNFHPTPWKLLQMLHNVCNAFKADRLEAKLQLQHNKGKRNLLHKGTTEFLTIWNGEKN